MKYFLNVFIIVGLIIFSFSGCKKQREGEAIVEPFLSTYKFTTYTVDTFRFKIVVNNVVLTDTFLSAPPNSMTKEILFTADSMANLKVINAANNAVFIDTIIKLDKIKSNIFPIVQLLSSQKPFVPSTPNEAAPTAGKVKVRFQFVQPNNTNLFFYDSVKCILRKNGVSLSVDTFILKRYGISKYYEHNTNAADRFTMVIKNPINDTIIHTGSSATFNTGTSGLTPFNTTVLYCVGASPTSGYRITRVY